MKAEVDENTPPASDSASTYTTDAGMTLASESGEETLAESEADSKSQAKKADSGNLVGKMNNLVTTDLSNITEARDFLLLSQSKYTTPYRILIFHLVSSSSGPTPNRTQHLVLVYCPGMECIDWVWCDGFALAVARQCCREDAGRSG